MGFLTEMKLFNEFVSLPEVLNKDFNTLLQEYLLPAEGASELSTV